MNRGSNHTASAELLVPRVAHVSAWPKHKLRAGTPKNESFDLPGSRTFTLIDKELTNNRIKIMNMKTDYVRLKKLMEKIKSKPKLMEPNEDGFSITGVNYYKQ